MRATILFFALTVLVSVAGVWWVNSRSPVEEELVAAEKEAAKPIEADPAGVSELRRQAWLDAIASQKSASPGQTVAARRQLAAEQARADFRLKGCFEMGEHCRCIGEDDQPVHLQAETCRIVASEPRVVQQ
jgi:hypothetical protein